MDKKSQELLLKSLTFINVLLENQQIQKLIKNEEVTFWQGAYAGIQIGTAGAIIEKSKIADLYPGLELKKKPGRPRKKP